MDVVGYKILTTYGSFFIGGVEVLKVQLDKDGIIERLNRRQVKWHYHKMACPFP